MALKSRLRQAILRTDSSTSNGSSTSHAANSSGASSPVSILSRGASNANAADLLPSTTHSSNSLSLSKSPSSYFSLSFFRSKKEPEDVFTKYAPRNFKFREPDPHYVATLSAWEFSFRSDRPRASSEFSGPSPCTSKNNSVCDVGHFGGTSEDNQ